MLMAINTIVFHLHFLSGVLCNSISVSPCIPLPDWKKKRGRKEEEKEEEERLLMGKKKKNKNSKKQGGRRSVLHVATSASSSSEVKVEVNKRSVLDRLQGSTLIGNQGLEARRQGEASDIRLPAGGRRDHLRNPGRPGDPNMTQLCS